MSIEEDTRAPFDGARVSSRESKREQSDSACGIRPSGVRLQTGVRAARPHRGTPEPLR